MTVTELIDLLKKCSPTATIELEVDTDTSKACCWATEVREYSGDVVMIL